MVYARLVHSEPAYLPASDRSEQTVATVIRNHTKAPAQNRAGIVAKFAQWATLKHEVTEVTKRQNKLRDEISAFVEANGYVDDKGSYLYDLPEPITAGGKTYTTIKRQRKVRTFFKEDEAEALLKSKGEDVYRSALTIPEPYLDQDKVYVLNQQGVLTDEEIDSLFGEKEDFAFTPVTE